MITLHLLSRALMFLMFGMAILDVITTQLALSQKDVTEGNPLWAFVMRYVGSWWIVFRLVFALASVYSVARQSPVTWVGPVVLTIGILITAYAVRSNWILYNLRKDANA